MKQAVAKNWDSGLPNENNMEIVLIDDDPVFCSLMAEQARRMSINLHFYHDLMQVQEAGGLKKYQMAILDYQLEQMNGLEVAEWIPMFFNDMPIVLISFEDRNKANTKSPWPGSIRSFVHKREGVGAILSQAVELRDQLRAVEDFKKRQQDERQYGTYRWLLGEHSIKHRVEENIHNMERLLSRNVHKIMDRFMKSTSDSRHESEDKTDDRESEFALADIDVSHDPDGHKITSQL